VETYWRLGLASGDIIRQQLTPYRLLHARHGLSVANMAMDFAPMAEHELRDQVEHLVDIAKLNPNFRLFSVDGDPLDILPEAYRSGFIVDHELAMLAAPTYTESDFPTMLRAENGAERTQIAEFILDQFPHRRDPQLRKLIIRANVLSDHELYVAGSLRAPFGALMLSQTEHSIGLYNLCVGYQHRSQGWGKRLVHFAQKVAAIQKKPLVLQSDQRLRDFYENLGCQYVGSFRAMKLRSLL